MAEIGTLGFLGCGNMGGAVARGALRAHLIHPKRVQIFVRHPPLQNEFAKVGVTFAAGPLELIQACDTIVLAVKPQIFNAEIKTWKSSMSGLSGKTFISVMAGIRTLKLRDVFPNQQIVRVMPNLGLSIGVGATAIAQDDQENSTLEMVETLFGACGTTYRVSESSLDAVTGLSGSGPMYVFEFVEALTDAGVHAGLNRETAYAMVLQTILGSIGLLQSAKDSPSKWSARVRSPGGTTEQGQRVLEEAGFKAILSQAVAAATKRSQELSA